jgi:hypothetical protein
MQDVEVQSVSWHQWPQFASSWERIHEMCPDASFFLSREWVDCWLTTFGPQLNPDLVVFLSDGKVVACCLLVWRTQWIKGVPLRRVFLNCAGEDETDSTCIEYNGLLSRPGYGDEATNALSELLRSRYWDELLLQGLASDSSLYTMATALGNVEFSEHASHYVDLCRLRDDGIEFDAVLSSNTRQQIRRSKRLYEELKGPCVLRSAATKVEAEEILQRLAKLHQTSWQDRGRPGVFLSPRFFDFHRNLVWTAFDRQKILLMEMRAGDEVVSALYSFLDRGRVYFYQSGFQHSSDGRLKPGLLAHYLAIRHCLEHSRLKEYDFLAGESQYKRSLAASSRTLRWISVLRRTPFTLTYRGLRRTKHLYRQLVGERGGPMGTNRGD